MKIIDFEKHGDVVRFYLGADDCKDYWGDDWDDAPYEHNAGPVYKGYIQDYVDCVFPFDGYVLEPCSGTYNSRWSKQDMIERKVPCIIYVPKKVADYRWEDSFDYWVGYKFNDIIRFYFGDRLEVPEDHFVRITG